MKLLLLVSLLLNYCLGAKILIFYPLFSKSHLYSFLPFLQQYGFNFVFSTECVYLSYLYFLNIRTAKIQVWKI